ncbi:MAG: F0F1 ATP synthase subunit delta [Steroidobacteraceae bacterium]
MPDKSTIARPYAKAAFEAASGRLGEWSEGLHRAAAVVADARVAALLDSPHVTPGQLAELICSIAGPHLDETGCNFIRALADNRRLECLPEVAARFDELKAEAEGTMDVEVASAAPLTDAQQRALANALERRLRRTVRLRCVLDPTLIGGASVRAGDLVIDGSLRSKLERITHQLTA